MSKKIKLLSITNGHGEDIIASTIIAAIRAKYDDLVEIDAYPMVGLGKTYSNAGIPIVTAESKQFPSGGFIYNSSDNMMGDIRSGVVQFTINQFKHIRQIAGNYDGAIVVGDVMPLMLAWWGKMNFVFYGAAKSEYDNSSKIKYFQPVYSGMERMVMKSSYCKMAAFRDKLTADTLRRFIGEKSVYLGNPMMDIDTSGNMELDKPIIALLPGSRDDAAINLEDMLRAVERVSAELPQYEYVAAITSALTDEAIAQIGEKQGYKVSEESLKGAAARLKKDKCRVYFSRDSFGQVISECSAVIGLAGTANEQAVGLGKPLVSFISRGIQYKERFARAQHNILGDSIAVAPTPEKAAANLIRILGDYSLYKYMSDTGKERMGEPGGSAKLAQAIIDKLGDG